MRKLVWYSLSGLLLVALLRLPACTRRTVEEAPTPQPTTPPPTRTAMPAGPPTSTITLFLAGDAMLGRGIDQILPHPSDPRLYEPYMQSARGYVELAEQAHGPIPQPVGFDYIWGDALTEWQRQAPDVKIINLETSITTSEAYLPDKMIHYRMHPANVPVLKAAGIDVCSLANNHVLDWGTAGLIETLETLQQAHIHHAGAGRNRREAEAPAVIEVAGKGRVLVFAYGATSSGIPATWAATADRPGVNLLTDLSSETIRRIQAQIAAIEQPGDIVVVSIHWGGNWGYEIPPEQRAFAHQLIDQAGVDVVHGHSSHHVKGIEVYRNRLILYGAGDFINDYEGIRGYENFRDDLTLMYFAGVEPATGELVHLQMTPMQIRHLRLNRASQADTKWLAEVLRREGKALGTRVEIGADNTLTLLWDTSLASY